MALVQKFHFLIWANPKNGKALEKSENICRVVAPMALPVSMISPFGFYLLLYEYCERKII